MVSLVTPLTLITLTSTVAVLGITAPPVPAVGAANWAPVHAGDFPDPSILYWQGTYYAFSTQSFAPAGQINIQVSTSSDGVDWTTLNGDALPALPSWASKGNTWAPSVAYDSASAPPEFVMYYVATDTAQGIQCLGMATAPATSNPMAPLGPYTDTNAEPVECQTGLGGSIDPDVFTDQQTGVPYLLWKNDGNHFGVGTQIWSVQLAPDLKTFVGSPVPILGPADEPWQGPVIEGPDMYYRPGPGTGGSGGTYYLFYAGGAVYSSTYAIGWATCTGPLGPCTDAPTTSNPILFTSANDPGMSGPGGPDVYTLQTSPPQVVMAFAAWQGNTIGYSLCGIRPMYLADLSFGTGTPSVPSLTPADPNVSPATGPSCPQPHVPQPGYWQVGSDGGVFTFGSARFYGSTGSLHLNQPVVGMAATPDDRGYWLVASDGGVFAFGDAPFYGSAGSDNLAYPVTAAAPSYLGGGYWLVDSNGGVHPFGNAAFKGQPPFAPGGYRITGMASTQNSNGYWLASANGNVAAFGNAAPYGSMDGTALNAPVVGMAATYNSAGYWLQGGDGGIFSFGNAPYLGSMGGQHLNAPMVGIASV